MQDVAEPISGMRLNDRVNMVWHDAPREQGVALSLKVKQAPLYELGCRLLSQQTRAVANIKQALKRTLAFHGLFRRKLFDSLHCGCRQNRPGGR